MLTSRQSEQTAWRRTALWGLLVIVVVSWTAREVPGFDFVAWDDELNILLNRNLGPPTAGNLAWMFTDVAYMRRYVPFGWLGFSTAYAMSGLSPAAYHLGNLMLHGANALLLYMLIGWSLRRWHPAADERHIAPCAAAGALCWAIHPLRAETIGWSSGMLYSLACTFALLSVLAYCRAQTTALTRSEPAWRWAAISLYAVSLLTYPITLGLIGVFCVIDAFEWRRRNRSAEPHLLIPPGGFAGEEPSMSRTHRPGTTGLSRISFMSSFTPIEWINLRRIAGEKIPFIITAVAMTAVTLYGRVTATSFWSHAPTLTEFGLAERVIRGFYTLAYYLWKSCWPAHLSPFPAQLTDFSPVGSVALASLLAVLGVTYFLWRRRHRWWSALLLWICYIILMIPLLGLTEKEYYTSDRYSYLPAMIASFALAGVLLSASRRVQWMLGSAVAVTLVAFTGMTSAQLEVWRNSPSLFARCIELSGSPKLSNNVFRRWVAFHAARGDVAAAEAVFGRAERHGLHPTTRTELAGTLAQARHELAVGAPPLLARLHGDIAVDLARAGRMREANEHFAAARKLAPGSATIRYNQAIHAATGGDARSALRLLLAALAYGNGTISSSAERDAWTVIAQAFVKSSEPELAAKAMSRATRLDEAGSGGTTEPEKSR